MHTANENHLTMYTTKEAQNEYFDNTSRDNKTIHSFALLTSY